MTSALYPRQSTKSWYPKCGYVRITCHRMGRGPMGTMGFGMPSPYSRSRSPRPPQNSTTFTGGNLRSSVEDRELRDRDHQLGTGRAVGELRGDLPCEVPRQDPDH